MRMLDGLLQTLAAGSGAVFARWAAALALTASMAAPVWAAGVLTIVEGEASIVDGARTLIAAEGLKLPDDVILRTGPRTGLVRVEWPDGTAADFGPDTQALINPAGFAARGGRAPSVYLLRGWLKQASLGKDAAGGFVAPRLDVLPAKGALVAQVAAEETWVFAESGALQFVERDAKPPLTLAAKSGEVYSRVGAAKGAVAPRPTPAQMQKVPRSFRDSLPLRLQALKDRQVEPRLGTPVSYAEVRDWLLVPEPAMRRGFVKRFTPRVRDNAFRAGLTEQLGAHPEWEPVLFPERFVKPKPASNPR